MFFSNFYLCRLIRIRFNRYNFTEGAYVFQHHLDSHPQNFSGFCWFFIIRGAPHVVLALPLLLGLYNKSNSRQRNPKRF